MLYTKFRENRPAGTGEEDFLVFFIITGRGGHLGHVNEEDPLKNNVARVATTFSPL